MYLGVVLPFDNIRTRPKSFLFSLCQADVCHAYQILHKNGIPDENIVVMMYDDIAHNKL